MEKQAFFPQKGYYFNQDLFPGQLVCAFSSRKQKNTSLYYGNIEESLVHREKFLAELGINFQNLVCSQQIHGNNVTYVYEKDLGRGALTYASAIEDTDALITDKKNIPLAIFTADCLSVFIYDPIAAAVGMLHAGWRSSRQEIIKNTVMLMQKKFNSQISQLYLMFGPAIRSCCYEVGKEFRDFFSFGLIRKNDRFYLDLIDINQKQAQELGILEQNIFDCGICTSCRNDEFFSYRKEGKDCGRMMSVAMLK
jgi:YfiH family protein